MFTLMNARDAQPDRSDCVHKRDVGEQQRVDGNAYAVERTQRLVRGYKRQQDGRARQFLQDFVESRRLCGRSSKVF